MATNENLRIAIVGAGIAGLSLFQALRALDEEGKWDIKVYESSNPLCVYGAGIRFWTRAIHILEAIDLKDQIVPILPDDSLSPDFVTRKGDQPQGSLINQGNFRGRNGCFLRSELIEVLKTRVTNELHLGYKLVSYDEGADGVVLKFNNGHVASCDLLVGADGINSAVRKCFLRSRGLSDSPSMNPVWTGTYIYRGLICPERLQVEFPGHRVFKSPVMYIGKYRSLVAYCVSRAGPITFAAIKSNPSKEGTLHDGPAVVPCNLDEILSIFEGWEPEAVALLNCLENPVKWALEVLPPMNSFANGSVALIGDAAHAMTPFQSAAGGQAVEDSYILASLLTSRNCSKTTISKITEIYSAVRCTPANQVAEISRVAGDKFHLRSPEFEGFGEGDTDVIPLDLMRSMFDTIGGMWKPLRKESIGECRERALAMLQEACAKE